MRSAPGTAENWGRPEGGTDFLFERIGGDFSVPSERPSGAAIVWPMGGNLIDEDHSIGFSAGSARERFNVKMKFPVMRHVAGEPNGAAVGEAKINLALGPAVLGGDHGNPPRWTVFAVHPHGPHGGRSS